MFTPAEAIEEMEYAVGELNLKVAMIASLVHRPLETVDSDDPTLRDFAYWIDNLSLDSQYDYDPFWSVCVELGIAPTAHSFMQGHGARRSVSNYMYNQIGHFADAGEAFAKALVLRGVTRRFPELNFGVLEGGVGWAASLFSTLVEVWGKRGSPAIGTSTRRNSTLSSSRGISHATAASGSRARPATSPVSGIRRWRQMRCRARRISRFWTTSRRAASRERRTSSISSPSHLLRLRGRRQADRNRLLGQGAAVRHEAEAGLRLGHWPLGRAQHERGARRGLRAGRGRSAR